MLNTGKYETLLYIRKTEKSPFSQSADAYCTGGFSSEVASGADALFPSPGLGGCAVPAFARRESRFRL